MLHLQLTNSSKSLTSTNCVQRRKVSMYEHSLGGFINQILGLVVNFDAILLLNDYTLWGVMLDKIELTIEQRIERRVVFEINPSSLSNI